MSSSSSSPHINSSTKFKSKINIICTPVDTHGLQFSDIEDVNLSNLKPICIKTPYVDKKKSPKRFTFNIKDELSLVDKGGLKDAFQKLSDIISIRSINNQISEINICLEFIRAQLVREKTIKNKIDMMILR